MSIMSIMQSTPLVRTLAKGTVVAALGLVALLPGLALADPSPLPSNVAADIEVTDGSVPFLLGHAIGTQDYICQLSDGIYAWTFVAPSATLYDDEGKLDATHFAGPTWQARDGSTVVGALAASVTVPDAIPWLLLKASSTTLGPDGGDRLTATTDIQRVNTTGGLKPATGCDAGSVGAAANVSYTADYYFYKLRD